MQVDAAVVHEEGGPFTMETVELEGPQDDELLVEVSAVGLCHTDLSVRDQYYPPRSRRCWATRARGSSARSGTT